MLRVQVAEWIKIANKGFHVISNNIIFFMIVFTQDVRPLKIENTKNGGRIILGMFRGMEPMKVGFISFPYHINPKLTCIQTEPLNHHGRILTLIKGYIVFTEPIQRNIKQ